MALANKLTNIANAIRGKTGGTDALTLEQMVTEIEGISAGGSDSVFVDIKVTTPHKNMTLDDISYFRMRCEFAETFGGDSFLETMGLREVIAPNAKTVEERAFLGCAYLERIDMPRATNIGSGAFADCIRLSDVNLPSVKALGSEVFTDCYGLKTIDLPMAESIGEIAFKDCEQITAIILRTTETVCVCDFSAFDGTPIQNGQGHIYVPSSMYEYYRAGYESALNEAIGTGAFDILFRKIEDYPEICG